MEGEHRQSLNVEKMANIYREGLVSVQARFVVDIIIAAIVWAVIINVMIYVLAAREIVSAKGVVLAFLGSAMGGLYAVFSGSKSSTEATKLRGVESFSDPIVAANQGSRDHLQAEVNRLIKADPRTPFVSGFEINADGSHKITFNWVWRLLFCAIFWYAALVLAAKIAPQAPSNKATVADAPVAPQPAAQQAAAAAPPPPATIPGAALQPPAPAHAVVYSRQDYIATESAEAHLLDIPQPMDIKMIATINGSVPVDIVAVPARGTKEQWMASAGLTELSGFFDGLGGNARSVFDSALSKRGAFGRYESDWVNVQPGPLTIFVDNTEAYTPYRGDAVVKIEVVTR